MKQNKTLTHEINKKLNKYKCKMTLMNKKIRDVEVIPLVLNNPIFIRKLNSR